MIRRDTRDILAPFCSAVLAACCLVRAARAEPAVTAVSPATVRPAARAEILLRGTELSGVRAITSRPSVRLEIGQVEPTQARASLLMPPDTSPGPLVIWPATAAGPAAPQLLLLDDLPVVEASRKHHTRANPQPLTAGVCVEGMSDAGLSHFFRITVTAGQRLACEVLAVAIRSRFDPVMRLWDASGKLLVETDDGPAGPECRLSHSFDTAGDVVLEIGDSSYRGGLAYRLRIGDFPLVSHALPLAVRRGTTTKVGFGGPDGPLVPPVDVTIPADATDTAVVVPARLPGGRAAGWVTLLVRDEPQVSGAATTETVTLPCGISGQLEQPGAKGSHRFRGTKDMKLRIAARNAAGQPWRTELDIK